MTMKHGKPPITEGKPLTVCISGMVPELIAKIDKLALKNRRSRSAQIVAVLEKIAWSGAEIKTPGLN